jgi:hypothetical protein
MGVVVVESTSISVVETTSVTVFAVGVMKPVAEIVGRTCVTVRI